MREREREKERERERDRWIDCLFRGRRAEKAKAFNLRGRKGSRKVESSYPPSFQRMRTPLYKSPLPSVWKMRTPLNKSPLPAFLPEDAHASL